MPFSRSATTRRNASSSSGKAARRRDRAEDGQLVKNAPSTLIFDLCASKSSESDVKVCIYCGMSADSIDHVPPRHLRAQLAEIELLALGTKEVDACRECNSALGRRPLLTITERRRYIKHYLRRKYRRYLAIPEWNEEKLMTVGSSLRMMIERNMMIRDDVRMRLRWKGKREHAIHRVGIDDPHRAHIGVTPPAPNKPPVARRTCRHCRKTFLTRRRGDDACQECLSLESMRDMNNARRATKKRRAFRLLRRKTFTTRKRREIQREPPVMTRIHGSLGMRSEAEIAQWLQTEKARIAREFSERTSWSPRRDA